MIKSAKFAAQVQQALECFFKNNFSDMMRCRALHSLHNLLMNQKIIPKIKKYHI